MQSQNSAHSDAAPTLRALIREVVSTSSLETPREIAAKVAESTPKKMVGDFYAEALCGLVADLLRQQRNTAIDAHEGDTAAKPGRSAKIAQRRDYWSELLATRLHIGGGRWILLGECDYESLVFAADERRADAAAELARADFYSRLADALDEHGVTTVRDLPADALRGLR